MVCTEDPLQLTEILNRAAEEEGVTKALPAIDFRILSDHIYTTPWEQPSTN